VLFLGASRIPTDKVRSDLFGDDPIGLRFVRTFGSFLRNPGTQDIDVVVFDEIVLEHAAVLYVALWLLGPKQFWACGDFGQMYYVPFLAGYRPKYASIVQYADIAMLLEGHRVPLDVYPAGLKVYGKDSGIHPCACEEHQRPEESLSVKRISGVSDATIGKNTTCLSHGQATKEVVRAFTRSKFGDSNATVSTIVEFQGGTADEVTIVREVTAFKPNTLYHEKERANVAISRSVGRTEYATCSAEKDAICELIEASKKIEYRDIIQENIRKYRGKASFGLKELDAFLNNRLDGNHPSVIAGAKFKASMC